MFGWIVGWMIRRSVRRLNEGDIKPLLSGYADDVHFVFPGESSFAADIHGKGELEVWLRRFVEVGLQLEPEDIVVAGWFPWSITVCLKVTDRARGPDGDTFYENRGVIFGKIVWGKIKSYEVFVDTQKLVGLDEYLSAHGLAAAEGVIN
jgi:ketosteroid isomerase-like protein